MSSSYTTLLGFVLPVTGELANTWGSTVNNSLTQLVEDSIAGYSTNAFAASPSNIWTLTTTAGGVAAQYRSAILIATGAPEIGRAHV